jgi:alpha-glucosidase (family GH31 glycosyl hydrolase)
MRSVSAEEHRHHFVHVRFGLLFHGLIELLLLGAPYALQRSKGNQRQWNHRAATANISNGPQMLTNDCLSSWPHMSQEIPASCTHRHFPFSVRPAPSDVRDR